MKLSIIIPAYNEEKRIIPTLEDYYNFFTKKFKKDFEIIVVPNNCKDNTLEIVSKFSKNKKNIIIKNIEKINGKGLAVIEGFKIAKGELIGFTDADNSINPENFYKLYENLKENDGIIASRWIKGAVVSPKRTIYQNISSFLFNIVARILFNLDYKDTQCGAKLFKKELAHKLSKKVTESKWSFDVELLYLCKENNRKVIESPINWKDAEGGTVTFKAGIESIIRLFKLRIKYF
jgi:glycosyltransferase involved in cell wall biosynthesis